MKTKDNSLEVILDKVDKNKYTVGYPPTTPRSW